jgi:uridine kinase
MKALSSDSFFDASRMPLDEDGMRNWELPQGVAYDLLLLRVQELKTILETAEAVPPVLQIQTTRGWIEIMAPHLQGGELLDSPVVIFIEGFLLFAEKEAAQMCDERIWIEIDKDTASQRRFARESRKWHADWEIFSEWFSGTVWHHYQEFCPLQRENAAPLTVEVLGAREKHEVVEEVTAVLKNVLEQNHGCTFPHLN